VGGMPPRFGWFGWQAIFSLSAHSFPLTTVLARLENLSTLFTNVQKKGRI
jgi:hypothetical protein